MKLKTDIDGTVEFRDIPYDVYIVEIKESNEFKGLKRVFFINGILSFVF